MSHSIVTNKIKQSFNRAANSYDENCHAQLQASVKLIQLLKQYLPNAQRILDLGCGTGITTQLLAHQYKYTDFHAIDIASDLLMKARQRLTPMNIKTHEMNFDDIYDIKPGFDIIYSNMAFQWSDDLSYTLKKIHALLRTNGYLAFSIPLNGTFKEIQHHCPINHFYGITKIRQHLLNNDYQLLMSHNEDITLTFSSYIDALKSIKKTGANHAQHKTHKGLNTKFYLNSFNTNELTYVIGYFIARSNLIEIS